ncbi:MAG: hypothetical protein WBC71_01000 [Salaquimonas sp.]
MLYQLSYKGTLWWVLDSTIFSPVQTDFAVSASYFGFFSKLVSFRHFGGVWAAKMIVESNTVFNGFAHE